ncbi:Kidins220 [Symbiodinium sp. CCMP2592]|nr:Kidins220 [Symbiodinium sp. CCMP2592]
MSGAASAEEEEFVGVRDRLLFSGGRTNYNYSVGKIPCSEAGESAALIAIAELGGRLIVAVPVEAWSRKIASRKLSKIALGKPILVEAIGAFPENMTVPAPEVTIKLWVGVLAMELESQVEYEAGAEAAKYLFNPQVLPFAEALVKIADEHFAFTTAESGGEGMFKRMSAVENGLQELKSMLQALNLGKDGTAAPDGVDPLRAARPKTKAWTPPWWEAEEAEDPGGLARVLVEDLEQEDLDDGADGFGGAEAWANPEGSNMEALLDGGSGSASSEGQGIGSGRRSAAALRMLTKAYEENRQLIYQTIERQMQLDFQVSPQRPGMPDSSGGHGTARGWLTAKSRVGNFHTHIRWVWMMAGVWDDLRRGDHEHARARAALMVAAADQEFSRHTVPQPSESQASALYDLRWTEVFLQVLRDRESFNEAKSKLALWRSRAALSGKTRRTIVRGMLLVWADPSRYVILVLLFGTFLVRVRVLVMCRGDFSPKQCRAIWPMPLPYEIPAKSEIYKLAGGDLKKAVVSLIVIVLNFLDLGSPPRAPDACLPGGDLHSDQWEQVRRLESFLDAWLMLGVLGPEDMGRTAGKVEDLETLLGDLSKFSDLARDHQPFEASPVIAKLRRPHSGAYKEVEANRLQFRGFPDFDPRAYLDPVSKKIYDEPFSTSLQPEHFEGKLPHVRIHCSRAERLQLFTLLDKSKRIRLFRRCDVRAQFGAGVFAVLKSLELDRLILDSRPHNLLETPPGRFIQSLGAGELLTRFSLEPNEALFASTNDIRGLLPSVQSGWMFGESELYVSLACLAMGDTQAVELAQSCHLGLCLQQQIVDEGSLLAMCLPVPRTRTPTAVGIVIDDFVALSKGRRPGLRDETGAKPDGEPTLGAQLADVAQRAYRDVHLIPHEAKAVRDQLQAEFWGLQLDGDRGFVRGSLRRAAPLLKIIVLALQLGVVSVSLLEVIAGGLIALFTFRRRLMSLLEEIFEVMRGRAQSAVLAIGQKLRDELLLIAVLLPCAVTDIRAEFAPEVYAVDASMWGEAVCSTTTSSEFVKELSRHCLSKGVWTRLLSPLKARARCFGDLETSEELPGGERDAFRSHPLWTKLATTLHYRLRWKT